MFSCILRSYRLDFWSAIWINGGCPARESLEHGEFIGHKCQSRARTLARSSMGRFITPKVPRKYVRCRAAISFRLRGSKQKSYCEYSRTKIPDCRKCIAKSVEWTMWYGVSLEQKCRPYPSNTIICPSQFRVRFKSETDVLVENGTIILLNFSEWATPFIAVPKTNDDMHNNMVCKVAINRMLRTVTSNPLTKTEDIVALLSRARVFWVADLKGAHQRFRISKQRRGLLTFNAIFFGCVSERDSPMVTRPHRQISSWLWIYF